MAISASALNNVKERVVVVYVSVLAVMDLLVNVTRVNASVQRDAVQQRSVVAVVSYCVLLVTVALHYRLLCAIANCVCGASCACGDKCKGSGAGCCLCVCQGCDGSACKCEKDKCFCDKGCCASAAKCSCNRELFDPHDTTSIYAFLQ